MAKARAGQLLRADGAPRLGVERAVGLALLVVVLVLAVGVGSAGSPLHIGGPSPVLESHLYVGDLIAILLLLLGGFWAVLLYLTWVGARGLRPGRDVEARRRGPGALFRALAIVSATLLAFALMAQNGSLDRLISPGGTQAGRGRAQNRAVDHPATTTVHWWIVAGFVLLAAAAAVIFLLRRKRGKRRDEVESPPDALVDALDRSLDDLEGERDPRRAVIRAYARMERALAFHGLPRRPHETSLEYLARLLTSLRVSRTSVKRLTALFERAKFSHHPVDPAMKAEAIEALSTVRAELEP